MALLSNFNVHVFLDRDNDDTAFFGIWDGRARYQTVDEGGNVDADGTVTGNGVRVREGT